MLHLLTCVAILLAKSLVNADNTNYFCTDLKPQCDISIERLLGMWYGIEIINHMEKERYILDNSLSCPILHLSAPSDTNTLPLHRNYNYDRNYGEQYSTYDHNYGERRQNGNSRQYQNRHHSRSRYPQDEARFDYNLNNDCDDDESGSYYGNEMGNLRIWWEENGVDTEYQLRYRKKRKGFWISSGPKNGSELIPSLRYFAGTVQVIKAVGSHMVLTFCHRQPDRKLFTIILSREFKPDYIDIHSIYRLLKARGLRSLNIKRLCYSNAIKIEGNIFLLLVLLMTINLLLH